MWFITNEEDILKKNQNVKKLKQTNKLNLINDMKICSNLKKLLEENFEKKSYYFQYNYVNQNKTFPCPICRSPKNQHKEKHHKKSNLYFFEKK